MSTFGKKSLTWWNYHKQENCDRLRFNSTPKEIQLKILEKWYPIGMIVGIDNRRFNHEIVQYVEHLTYWSVKVVLIFEGSILNGMIYEKNPLDLYPSPESEKQIKRDEKLKKIL